MPSIDRMFVFAVVLLSVTAASRGISDEDLAKLQAEPHGWFNITHVKHLATATLKGKTFGEVTGGGAVRCAGWSCTTSFCWSCLPQEACCVTANHHNTSSTVETETNGSTVVATVKMRNPLYDFMVFSVPVGHPLSKPFHLMAPFRFPTMLTRLQGKQFGKWGWRQESLLGG